MSLATCSSTRETSWMPGRGKQEGVCVCVWGGVGGGAEKEWDKGEGRRGVQWQMKGPRGQHQSINRQD